MKSEREVQKIGFVARGLTQGGVGRFVTNVLREWNQDKHQAKRIIVFTDEKDFVSDYPQLEIVYIPKAPKIIWDNFLLLVSIIRHKVGTVVYTKNVIPLTHLFMWWKKITVVYDLGFFYPELDAYKKMDTWYMKVMTRLTLPRADKIMAISQFTKDEIIKFLGISEKKIFVNHLGVEKKYRRVTDTKILKKVVNKYKLELPFIFYCGSLSPRKNILRLVQTFHQIQDKVPYHLYLVSGQKWNNPGVEEYVEKHSLGKRVHLLSFIPEEDLITFYSLADAYVYPSLYEGFGVPIIEAQACGCLVIASDLEVCGEIGGEGIWQVSVLNVDAWGKALLSLTKKSDLIKQTVKNGTMNANKFSWTKTCSRLVNEAG